MNSYPFHIFYSKSYQEQPDKKWPLILFLHGAGERGNNLEVLKQQGLPRFLQLKDDFPFIVAYPQCPGGSYWNIELLNNWYDEVLDKVNVDETRIYLTGISMGGYGTWHWTAANPEKFTAIIPVCGGGQPDKAEKLTKMPIWAFHGQKDNIVPVEETLAMTTAIERAGGHPKVTIYPDLFHDSWTKTYQNEEIYRWLLEQKTTK